MRSNNSTSTSTRPNAYERLARLSQQDPFLRPIAFDALLREPRCMLLVEAGSVKFQPPDIYKLKPACWRVPDGGGDDNSLIVFSCMSSFQSFGPGPNWVGATPLGDPGDIFGFQGDVDRSWLVDPQTPHVLRYSAGEVSAWRKAVERPAAFNPISGSGWEFLDTSDHFQGLLDRLAALLSTIEQVQLAYLLKWRVLGTNDPHQLALLLGCPDMDEAKRVCRAVPLLNAGLEAPDRIACVIPIDWHRQLARDLAAGCAPVYEQSMSRWLTGRASR